MKDDELDLKFEARVVGHREPAPRREVSDKLRGVRFETDGREHVFFEGVVCEEVDFSGNRFAWFWADNAKFLACNFRDARFDALNFANTMGTLYRDCSFDGADLSMLDVGMGRARFERCSFEGSKVRGWFSFEGAFVDCRFATKVVECIFHGHERDDDRLILDRLFRRPLRRNEFRGNDFRRAELIWTAFTRGIDISAQLWPEGDEYLRLDRVPERLARARREISAWPDSHRRTEALGLLTEVFEWTWEGQEEVFARRDRLGNDDEGDDLIAEIERLIETAL